MAKLVAWFPRPVETGAKSSTLVVETEKRSLLVAYNSKDERLWVYNADQIPRWAAEHKRELQRWAQDHKAEARPVPPFAQRRENAAQKYRARVDSACHQIAAYLAGYARRRGFSSVTYDDHERGFCPEFPYAKLRTRVQRSLDEHKIEVHLVQSASIEADLEADREEHQ